MYHDGTTIIIITINASTIIIITIVIVIIIVNILITWLHLSSTLAKISWLGSLSSSIYETPTLISSYDYVLNILRLFHLKT